jgi:hypothetical protein
MNIRGLLRGVRIHARDPRAQQPSDRTLLHLLSVQIQNFLTELNIYGNNYSVDETQITVTPNTGEYLIGVEGFGKPIEVRTLNAGDPAYTERTVDFFELGDLHYQWDLPNNFGQAYWQDGSNHSTQRIAFYRRRGNIYARVLPVPAQSAKLNIIYQVGVFGSTTPLDEDVLMPEHHALLEVRTALVALPHCEWFDDESMNQARRKELALSLADQRDALTKVFRANIVNQTASTEPDYREVWSFDD